MSSDNDDGEEILDPALVVAFVSTRPRRREGHDLPGAQPFALAFEDADFEAMKNEIVVVRLGGLDYRGRLVGADEKEVYLKAETRWLVLPFDRVTSVKRVRENPSPLGNAVSAMNAAEAYFDAEDGAPHEE